MVLEELSQARSLKGCGIGERDFLRLQAERAFTNGATGCIAAEWLKECEALFTDAAEADDRNSDRSMVAKRIQL